MWRQPILFHFSLCAFCEVISNQTFSFLFFFLSTLERVESFHPFLTWLSLDAPMIVVGLSA
jgi:hypothetical protein